MYIEGAPAVPGGEFTKEHLAGEVPGQQLVTVAQASAGPGGEILRNRYKSCNATSSSSTCHGLLRVVDEAEPEVSVDSFVKCVNEMRAQVKTEGRNAKSRKVLEVAEDPNARRAAVNKLDKLVDTSKADAAKESLVQRYVDVASSLCGVVGCYSSLYEFLAVSLDSYKTTAAAVRQVMKTDLCVMSGEEKEDMEAVLRRLKTRGHIGREDQRTPLTLVDIFEVHLGGALKDSELTVLLLCFYCGFRPSEVKKLAVDYVGETDAGIKARWENGDLIVNFKEASTKVNQYKSVRVKCMCKKFEKLNVNKRYCICALESKMDQFSSSQDAYEISKRVFKNVRDIGGHSYRIGCTIWLCLAMVDPLRILVHCRWGSMAMLLRYLRPLPEVKADRFWKQLRFAGV
eukprot:g17836.t1